MYKLIVESGNPAGELISEHATIEQAHQALIEAIEADAENVMRYGIDGQGEPPTYSEALEYARDFYILEGK